MDTRPGHRWNTSANHSGGKKHKRAGEGDESDDEMRRNWQRADLPDLIDSSRPNCDVKFDSTKTNPTVSY